VETEPGTLASFTNIAEKPMQIIPKISAMEARYGDAKNLFTIA
jgi:hypothetical protein